MQVVKIEQKHSEYPENFFDWLFFLQVNKGLTLLLNEILYTKTFNNYKLHILAF